MVNLIIGSKGSGKTKVLIEQINETAKTSKGNVICIEKNMNLIHDIDNAIRLIDADSYYIDNFEKFYGFFAGILAGNYDITDVYVDGILRIGTKEGKDVKGFEELLEKLSTILKENDVNVTFTVSTDENELSDALKEYPIQYL